MSNDPENRLVTLNYASAPAPDPIHDLRAMQFWRSISVIGLVGTILGILLFPPLAVVSLMGMALGTVMTLICMTRASASQVSVSYAVRHLVLAIILLPIFLLGVLVVPLLVQSDLTKWREREDMPSE